MWSFKKNIEVKIVDSPVKKLNIESYEYDQNLQTYVITLKFYGKDEQKFFADDYKTKYKTEISVHPKYDKYNLEYKQSHLKKSDWLVEVENDSYNMGMTLLHAINEVKLHSTFGFVINKSPTEFITYAFDTKNIEYVKQEISPGKTVKFKAHRSVA